MFFVAVIHSFSIFSWYWDVEDNKSSKHQTGLKILHSNVLTSNQHFHLLTSLLEKEKPHMVILQEINTDWIDGIKSALSDYKYRLEKPQNDNFGIAIYSQLPFITSNVITLGNLGLASIEVTFTIDEQAVTLIATHPIPPLNDALYLARNDQLIDAAKRIASKSTAKILLGDFNVSMWSSDYLVMESISGLKNARQGFGILPTWPANLPFPIIPIDHILVSDAFVVNDFNVGDNIGSDHLPIIVELALRKNDAAM